MVDTIFFDFVGVLLFPKGNYETSPQVDEIDQQVGAVTNDNVFREKILCQYNLLEHNFSTILQAVVNKYEPYIPLWEILPKIRKRYKLGIINNGTYLTYPFFDAKFQIGQRFDLFLSSGKAGVCKPDRAIYLQACAKLGSEPQNCLFMDDSKENIIGAQMVGMQAIHWPNRESGLLAFNTYLAGTGRAKIS